MSTNISSKYHPMFKAYDVRGILTESDNAMFYWFGFGFVTKILIPENLETTVNLTHDARILSPYFYNFVCQGIIDAGGKVNPLGYGSTDFLYAACTENGLPGIQLTASHNPSEWHGMKIVKQAPQMLGLESGLDIVRDFVLEKMENSEDKVEALEFKENSELRTQVLDFFLSKFIELGNPAEVDNLLRSQNRKLRLVVDTGNGIAGHFMPKIQEMYNEVEFLPLYWEMDGNFPNHPANPQEYENLIDLKDEIARTGADFGFAFDGDGDRLAIVDEIGRPIQGDFLVASFSSYLLKNYDPKSGQDKAVVYLQPGSRSVVQAIANYDGIAVPSRQGHMFIKQAMSKYNAVYGGEFSGHHYFPQLMGMDSGFLPLGLFIKMYVENGTKAVSSMFQPYAAHYFISELMSPTIPENQSWSQWEEKLKTHFAGEIISYMDGFSVYCSDWKFNMRPSNTEPKVRFILETYETDRVAEKIALIKKIVGLE